VSRWLDRSGRARLRRRAAETGIALPSVCLGHFNDRAWLTADDPDFEAVADALDAVGFDGWLVLETPRPAAGRPTRRRTWSTHDGCSGRRAPFRYRWIVTRYHSPGGMRIGYVPSPQTSGAGAQEQIARYLKPRDRPDRTGLE
jgi:hypothetical protein